MFWDYWLKFLKVLLTSECVTGLLLNFIKTFFITFATVSYPFSICNSQFTHFLTGVDFEFFTTIFKLLFSLKFLVEVFVSACNLEITHCNNSLHYIWWFKIFFDNFNFNIIHNLLTFLWVWTLNVWLLSVLYIFISFNFFFF